MDVLKVITNNVQKETIITDLAPFVRYKITLSSQNYLYDVDNTTDNSANISVKLLEGGKAFIVRLLTQC